MPKITNVCGLLSSLSHLQGLDEVFLDDYFRKFDPLWDFFSFKISYLDNVPLQSNGADCGLFVMKFMEMQCDIVSIKYVCDIIFIS